MIPDDARRLLESVPVYSRETQAARRHYIRRIAAEAAELLTRAANCDDPDELGRLVSVADQALIPAVTELCRAHLG